MFRVFLGLREVLRLNGCSHLDVWIDWAEGKGGVVVEGPRYFADGG